jgi:hypothetical protein
MLAEDESFWLDPTTCWGKIASASAGLSLLVLIFRYSTIFSISTHTHIRA